MKRFDAIVIGAGPSGMMAAIQASKHGSVCIIERCLSPGKKLLLTGGGRCNITANFSVKDFLKGVTRNPSFLFSSLYQFSSEDSINFFKENNVELITEKLGAVFPESNKAETIRHCFVTLLQQNHISINHGYVDSVKTLDGGTFEIHIKKEKSETSIECTSLIVSTGGKSYPQTGSDGTGFTLAQNFGHTIENLEPGLTSFNSDSFAWGHCKGISIQNVNITLKKLNKAFTGDFLFTNNGISGPVVLNASLESFEEEDVEIDFLPSLSIGQWKKSVSSFREKGSELVLSKWLKKFLPKRVTDTMIENVDFPLDRTGAVFSKEEERSIFNQIKKQTITNMRKNEIGHAMITLGGVNVKEINPKTMESKLVKNLFFAGEIIDVSGKTGGYNLQIALTTGFVAGQLGNQ
ncbi:MAG: aminoacetone oxidase family FAD-binding enzyme [Caldisericia bacterium]|nr:aminoacetone oxidase family FAD-binding enzyme [Caldisericia bacterium]